MKGKKAAAGALVGGALGDAMGFPVEFNGVAAIVRKCGAWRDMPLPLSGGLAYVSDDTQMTLALGDGLQDVLRGGGALTPETMVGPVRERFVAWCFSEENNRAPGGTCLRACEALAWVGRWQAASDVGSKGCGATMRVAPVALVPGLDAEGRAGAAQLQAALTHGHPTALAAADLTAHAVWLLARGAEPGELIPELRDHAHRGRGVYPQAWLGDLADRTQDPDRTSYATRGWDECLAVLDRLEDALRAPDVEADPCEATGAGWIAEESLATALYCFLLLPDDPVAVIRRAACSSGDSDSLAAIAGTLAGARHGLDAWPARWVRDVEHRDRLLALGSAWDG